MVRTPDRGSMGGQMAENAEPLAIVLSRWIRRERLRPGDIERAAGISRNHLWLMTHGKVTRPTPETLRKLAHAVATDPDTGAVDPLKRDEALRDFSRAAGYPDLSEDIDEGDLARAIRAAVGNQQATEFWVEMIRAHRDISPTVQQLIKTVIDLHNRPGGGGVTGLLLLLGDADPAARDALIRRLTGNGELILS